MSVDHYALTYGELRAPIKVVMLAAAITIGVGFAPLRGQSPALCTGTPPTATIVVNTTEDKINGYTNCVAALLAEDPDHVKPGDDRFISFGEAVEAINSDAGIFSGRSYIISFDPTVFVHGATIAHRAPFTITAPSTTIDGDTTADDEPDVLFASSPYAATLIIKTHHVVLRHLVLQEVIIEGARAQYNEVNDCFIGTDVDAASVSSILGRGITICDDAAENMIDDNIIGGRSEDPAKTSGYGLLIRNAHRNLIRGNAIGVNRDGDPLANANGIIVMEGSMGNVIGGVRLSEACDFPCNLISGNALNGIQIIGSDTKDNVVAGNYIGVDPTGTAAMANGVYDPTDRFPGVVLDDGAANNRIGGDRGPTDSCVGPCNVISGNGEDGIQVQSSAGEGNEIEGNYIGISANGAIPLGNQSNGIAVGSAKTVIGMKDGEPRSSTVCDGRCNVISGNRMYGIQLYGPAARGTKIRGNFIGVNPRGDKAMANRFSGIAVLGGANDNEIGGDRGAMHQCIAFCNLVSGNDQNGIVFDGFGTNKNRVFGNYILENKADGILLNKGPASTTIGASRASAACTGSCNVISGNAGRGVHLRDIGTRNTFLEGNFIGVTPDGTGARPNLLGGVHLADGPHHNEIGGSRTVAAGDFSCKGPCNLIAHNKKTGISLVGSGTRANRIRGNEIRNNEGLGIDLGNDGVTPNTLAPASGPNDSMPFPVGVTGHLDGSSNLRISGVLDVQDPELAFIDIYLNDDSPFDPRTTREATVYLGETRPTKNGSFTISVPIPPGTTRPLGFISATATNGDSSTSEISPVCGPDSDGDGLCDTWETKGIDFDDDGTVDLPLHEPPFNAKANVKDIFVEIDHFEIYEPDPGDLARVGRAFANAPGGPIVLHSMVDEAIPSTVAQVKFDDRGPAADDDFLDFKHGLHRCGTADHDGHFGTEDDRSDDNCTNILGARRLVFRYALFASDIADHKGISGKSDGASDLMVAVAAITPPEGGRPKYDKAAGTYMHELGHTLGLCHGGPLPAGTDYCDDAPATGRAVNRKPNYLSVMSYTFQYAEPFVGRPLDYSRWALPPTGSHTLFEDNLDERNGINDNTQPADLASWSRTYFTLWNPASLECEYESGPTAGDIDWNGDGLYTSSVQARINDRDRSVVKPCRPLGTIPPTFNTSAQTLTGHEDWTTLRYNFRYSDGFVSSSGTAESDDPPLATEADEIAEEEDFDGDGIVDAKDDCPSIPGESCGFTLRLEQASVIGGVISTAVVTFSPRLTASARVEIFSANEPVVQIPVAIRDVLAGASETRFTLNTVAVLRPVDVPIIVRHGVRDVTETLTVGVDATKAADLAVTVTASHEPVTLGNAVLYTYTVTNHELMTATGVALKVRLPSGFELRSVTPSASCSGTLLVQCALGTLAQYAIAQVVVIVRPGSIGTFEIPGTASTSDPDSNASNDSATWRTTVSAPVCVRARSDLIAWWPGNDSTVNVTGGPNLWLTKVHVYNYDAAKIGRGFRLNGVDDSATVPNTTDFLPPSSGFSVELWLRGDKTSTVREMGVISRSTSSSLDGAWRLHVVPGSGRLKFSMSDGISTGVIESDVDVLDEQFHHVAAIWEPDGSAGILRLYVDALPQLATARAPSPNPSKGILGVGTGFKGILDEISLYRVALTPTEIERIYRAASAGKCLAETRLKRVSPDVVSPVSPDTTTTAMYEISNQGPSAAESLEISQAAPANTSIIGCKPPTCALTADRALIAFGSFEPGRTEKFELTTRVHCTAPTGMMRLEVCATSQTPHPLGFDGKRCIDQSFRVENFADLHLSGSGLKERIGAGTPVHYAFAISAGGGMGRETVSGCASPLFKFTLAKGWSPAVYTTSSGTCAATGRIIECTLGPVVGPLRSCLSDGAQSIHVNVVADSLGTMSGVHKHDAEVSCAGSSFDRTADNHVPISTEVCAGSTGFCFGGPRNGQLCGSTAECPSVCVPNPDRQSPPPIFATPCSSDFQCPDGYHCGGGVRPFLRPFCDTKCPTTIIDPQPRPPGRFELIPTAGLPSPGSVYLPIRQGFTDRGEEREFELNPGVLWGAGARLKIGLGVRFIGPDRESLQFESIVAAAHVRLTAEEGHWPLAVSGSYEFAREDEDRGELGLTLWRDFDASHFAIWVGAGEERVERADFEWEGRGGYRHRLRGPLDWGLEARWAFGDETAREVLAGLYFEPAARWALHATAGTGLNEYGPEFVVRTSLTWRAR